MAYKPTVSLTFDGPYSTVVTTGLPVMISNGLIGTAFCSTLSPYMNNVPFASDAQVASLAAAGWEIGMYSGVLNGRNMDGAVAVEGVTAVSNYLSSGKGGLASLGYTPTALGPTGRRWTDYRLQGIASDLGFTSVRAAGNTLVKQTYPVTNRLNVYGAGSTSLTNTDTAETLTAKIDALLLTNDWLILAVHGIATGDSYYVPTAAFTTMCEYIKAKQDLGLLRCVTFTEGLTPEGSIPAPDPMVDPVNAEGFATWDFLI